MISVWNRIAYRYRRPCSNNRCWECLGSLLNAIKNGWRPVKLPYIVTFDADNGKLISDDPWYLVSDDATDQWSLLVFKLKRLSFKRRCRSQLGRVLRDAHGCKHEHSARGC